MLGTRAKLRSCHKGRVQGARQAGRGSTAAGSSQGSGSGGDLCIQGHFRAPLARREFGQQTHSTGNCCLNYSASLNPAFTVTEALGGEIFLWLQRTPDQTPVILLFLDGKALKLKNKNTGWHAIPGTFCICHSTFFFFFNWNNPDVCLKRKQDPCGKYLSIHSLSCSLSIKYQIFKELSTFSMALIKGIIINKEYHWTRHVHKKIIFP